MYKRYTRLSSILLPVNFRGKKNELSKLLTSRKSYRNFSGRPIRLEHISELLYYSGGLVRRSDENPKELRRAYPSAGAKYPLEIYLLIQHCEEVKPGLYHYDVSTHSLEVLLQPVLPSDIKNIWRSQGWFRKAAMIIIIAAKYTRTTRKYGAQGAHFPLIEAGHLGQNIYLLCETMGLGCCSIGQFNEKEVISFLDIDPNDEYPVYYLAVEKLI